MCMIPEKMIPTVENCVQNEDGIPPVLTGPGTLTELGQLSEKKHGSCGNGPFEDIGD